MRRNIKINRLTLIEIMVYLAVLTLVSALSYRLFFQGLKKSEEFRLSAQQIADVNRVGDQWRKDIRMAQKITQRDNILNLSANNKFVCAYKFADKKLYNRRGSNGKWKVLLKKIRSLKFFTRKQPGFSIWHFDVELESEFEPRVKHPVFSFMAVNRIPIFGEGGK